MTDFVHGLGAVLIACCVVYLLALCLPPACPECDDEGCDSCAEEF